MVVVYLPMSEATGCFLVGGRFPKSTVPVRSYRDLLMWQQSMNLVVTFYRMSSQWPTENRYGRTQQARRAAISIPSNVAEAKVVAVMRSLLDF